VQACGGSRRQPGLYFQGRAKQRDSGLDRPQFGLELIALNLVTLLHKLFAEQFALLFQTPDVLRYGSIHSRNHPVLTFYTASSADPSSFCKSFAEQREMVGAGGAYDLSTWRNL
jgi:hypothetical protein